MPRAAIVSEQHRYNNTSIRILSLVPTSRGTGYAVVESPPLFVIDRGVLSSKEERRKHINDLGRYLTWYRPDVLLLEDIHSAQCKRGEKTRSIITDVIDLAGGYGIAVRPVAKDEIFAHFDVPQTVSKVVIARKVTELLPELATLVPSERKLWETEAYWMPMFEAMAQILTALKAH